MPDPRDVLVFILCFLLILLGMYLFLHETHSGFYYP